MRALLTFLLACVILSLAPRASALSLIETTSAPNDELYEAQVVQVLSTRATQFDTSPYYEQRLRINVNQDGTQRTIEISSGYIPFTKEALYATGDTILVGYQSSGLTDEYWYVIGHKRSNILVLLAAVFCAVVLFVARRQGLRALLAMIVTGSIVLFYLLPLLFNGRSPLLVLSGFTLIILPINFYLSHGISKKTTVAVASSALVMMTCIFVTGQLVSSLHLTGLTSEQLQSLLTTDRQINLTGLVAAGILIGVLGIIDDVTITQASIVHELVQSNPKESRSSLFSKSMNVGRDHIASVINTLILVYAGSGISTLLLMTVYPRPLEIFFNSEEVSTQLLIMLLSSIALVVAIPLTSAIASYFYAKK